MYIHIKTFKKKKIIFRKKIKIKMKFKKEWKIIFNKKGWNFVNKSKQPHKLEFCNGLPWFLF